MNSINLKAQVEQRQKTLHELMGSHKVMKIKRKIICAIATAEKNENIDMWLTLPDKQVIKVLKHDMHLVAVFSKQVKKANKTPQT